MRDLDTDQTESMEYLKVPPNSIPSEQSIIGGLLLSPEAFDEIITIISSEDFYRPDHRLIFEAIISLGRQDKPIDAVTVSDQLETSGTLNEIGGLAYLGSIAKNTPSAANIKAYAEKVREHSILRALIATNTATIAKCYKPDNRNANEILGEAEAETFAITEKASNRVIDTHVSSHFKEVCDNLTQRIEQEGALSGISTGFKDINIILSGLNKGDLIIVAGRPSMGKTTFAINTAENAADVGIPVQIFSFEMSAEALTQRMACSAGRVDANKVRSGEMTDDEMHRFMTAGAELSKQPIDIIDKNMTPLQIAAIARRHKRKYNTGLIVIDYLQLMDADQLTQTRALEISSITKSLKRLAQELNIPIVLLSQLNRKLEERSNKRPVMSDLKDSGSIEEDADVVMFVYRDEYYNDETLDKGIAEIIIAKQRNGPLSTVRLKFTGKFTRFDNLD